MTTFNYPSKECYALLSLGPRISSLPMSVCRILVLKVRMGIVSLISHLFKLSMLSYKIASYEMWTISSVRFLPVSNCTIDIITVQNLLPLLCSSNVTLKWNLCCGANAVCQSVTFFSVLSWGATLL